MTCIKKENGEISPQCFLLRHATCQNPLDYPFQLSLSPTQPVPFASIFKPPRTKRKKLEKKHQKHKQFLQVLLWWNSN